MIVVTIFEISLNSVSRPEAFFFNFTLLYLDSNCFQKSLFPTREVFGFTFLSSGQLILSRGLGVNWQLYWVPLEEY